jgi:hypothetical protein
MSRHHNYIQDVFNKPDTYSQRWTGRGEAQSPKLVKSFKSIPVKVKGKVKLSLCLTN